jgi:two-component system chemotaxis sensor kinase CheA
LFRTHDSFVIEKAIAMTDSQAIQDEMLEALMGDFLDESTLLLAQLNEKLLALDSWAKNEAPSAAAPPVDMLNDMFRAAHSLKGLSGMLRLTDINRLTHKVENVFDAARNAILPVTDECVDVIFPAIDCISAMIDALRSNTDETIDSGAVVERIETLLSRNNALTAVGDQKDVERELAAMQAQAAASAATNLKPAETTALETVILDPLASIVDDTDIPARYLSIYLDETTLTLDELTEKILSSDNSSFGALLGLCHRLKGSSASIGLHRPAKLAHAMEDYLQDARRSHAVIPAGANDQLLECVDGLRTYINSLKEGYGQQDKLGEAAIKMVKLRSELGAPQDPVTPLPQQSAPKKASGSEHRAVELAACAAAAPEEVEGIVGYLRFEPNLPLVECKAQLLLNKLDQIGATFYRWTSETNATNPDEAFELIFGVATELDESAIKTYLIIEGVEEVELFPLIAKKPVQTAVSAALPLAAVEKAPVEACPPGSKTAASAAPESKSKPTETLRVDIERLDQLMNLAGQLVINRARFGQISEGLKSLVSFRAISHSLSNAQHHAARIAQGLSEQDREGDISTETLSELAAKMRDDLDSLQRDMAQLTRIRAAVASLADAVHQLDRVSDGIQSTVMDTRMVPIGPLFSRFKRVIRDLSRDNRKDIRLDILGENTELDKRMIDELGDPLIHLVRNSVDHGIESAEARIAAGKPAQGVVSLNAFHRGNRIVIEVTDDGKGLDVDKILAKALSKGLITEAEAETMTPQQIQALIWRPGFSTAEKVTEVSGRGMGMDIVWSKIESLNGVVEVSSEKGKGCTFLIKLPLTMAILPSLLSVIGDEVFAIPVESVTEIVRVRGEELSTVQGKNVLRVRGRVISMIELDEIFEGVRAPDFAASLADRESITMVIVGADSREIAIVVDRLIGEQDVVIQSLAENFQNVDGIAGASILGDGRISLILDVPALLEKSSRLAKPVLPHAVDKDAHLELASL